MTTLACPSCGRRYDVAGNDPGKTYTCKNCQVELALPTGTGGAPAGAGGPEPTVLVGSPASKPAPTVGKYRIQRELGRGGMGVVYEAFDAGLRRRVALKMMIGSPNLDPAEAALEEERFLREARLTASLPRHPHIVSVHEAGTFEGKRFIAMEFIDGLPMSKWRTSGSVTIRRQVALLRDVALAVHHAHRHRVIHRDLKPENILVDVDHQPHVTDFGLAKSVGQNVSLSLTASGMIMGTPAYMSPEQAQGMKGLDHRTDVYALGVMLYEILTGRLPFTGETAIEILMKAARTPAPAPSTIVETDKAIENVCLKALAKKPKERYATAEAFAQDITRWLKGEEVQARAPARPKFLGGGRGSGVRTAVAIGGLVALLVVAGVALWPEPARPSVEADLARARALMAQKNYADARVVFALVLAKDPGNAEARDGTGRARELEEEEKRKLEERLKAAEKKAAEEKEKPTAETKKTGEPLVVPKDPEKKNDGEPKTDPPAQLKAATVDADKLKPGLIGEYFRDGFDRLVLRRIDAQIAFDWGDGPPHPRLEPNGFQARWTGYLRAPKAGRYMFEVKIDDAVRFWLDDVPIIGSWQSNAGVVYRGECDLEAGYHRLHVRFAEAGSAALILLRWSGGDAGETRLIGPEYFFHDPAEFAPLGMTSFGSSLAPRLPRALYLSDLTEIEVRTGWGDFMLGRVHQRPISVSGRRSPHGLAAHANSRVDYVLSRRYEVLEGTVGINDSALGDNAGVSFKIVGDGRSIWQSYALKKMGQTMDFRVSVRDVHKLELIADCEPDNARAHAVWIEPRLTLRGPRAAVPKSQDLEQALAAIRGRPTADWIEEGLRTDDPTERFVLLREARNIAVANRDLETAFRAINLLGVFFDIDPLEWKEKAIDEAMTSAGDHESVREIAFLLVDDAVFQDRYDVAKRVLGKLRADTTEVERLSREFADIAVQRKALEKNPEDAKANLAVGKFWCLHKRDWTRGLPLLARAAGSKLGTAAILDLKDPREIADLLSMAKAWEQAGAELSDLEEKKGAYFRAIHGYGKAVPLVPDSQRAVLVSTVVRLLKLCGLERPPARGLVFWLEPARGSPPLSDWITGKLPEVKSGNPAPPRLDRTELWYAGLADGNKAARGGTVVAWVKTDAGDRMQVILERGSTANRGFQLGIERDQFRAWLNTQPTEIYLRSLESAVKPGEWVCGVLSWDDREVRIYVNGVLQGTMGVARRFPEAGSLVRIGRGGWEGDEFFQGEIGAVLLYDRPLSQEEIDSIHGLYRVKFK